MYTHMIHIYVYTNTYTHIHFMFEHFLYAFLSPDVQSCTCMYAFYV